MKTRDSKNPNLVVYYREPGDPIPDDVKKNIADLLANPNRTIDTSDIPELTEEFWKNAVWGRFYRPMKKQVNVRLDADVLAWLKRDGKGYQTRLNGLLRREMLAEMRKKKA